MSLQTQIQQLHNEYNSLVTQYTDTYKNFIDAFQSNDIHLMNIPNTSFMGEKIIDTIKNSSIDSCKSSCSSNPLCSGANINTLNSNTYSCSLYSGNGNIVSTENSIAIVHHSLYYSYQLQQINSRLLRINKEIMSISQNSYGDFQQNQQKSLEHNKLLQHNYYILTEERTQIDEMIRQFETLNSAIENGSTQVTTNYSNYIVLLFITILLIFIMIRYSII